MLSIQRGRMDFPNAVVLTLSAASQINLLWIPNFREEAKEGLLGVGVLGHAQKRRFIEMLISHSAQSEGVQRPRKECKAVQSERGSADDPSSLVEVIPLDIFKC